MRRTIVAVTAGFLVGLASMAHAQDRVRVELVPGVSFATEMLGDTDLKTGAGVEFNVGYRFMPHLGAYVGWDWRQFPADISFAGEDVDVEETGYAFGVRFEHPLAGARSPAAMVRVGATYNHIEIEDAAGDLVVDSGHGFGWEAAAGLAMPVGERWHVTPAVRVRSLDRDIRISSATTPVTLRYVTLEVGFARGF